MGNEVKFNLANFRGNTIKMKVKEALKDGKSIYKNIKGHENEINYVLIDLPCEKTGLKNLILCMNVLYPGKVNKEYKMTRGHKHNAEEVYIFLEGKGDIFMDKKRFDVTKGDVITVPVNVWHRTVNRGKNKLIYLTVFEKSYHNHMKK